MNDIKEMRQKLQRGSSVLEENRNLEASSEEILDTAMYMQTKGPQLAFVGNE